MENTAMIYSKMFTINTIYTVILKFIQLIQWPISFTLLF